MEIPHCEKHEIFMTLKDLSDPSKGWICLLCEKEESGCKVSSSRRKWRLEYGDPDREFSQGDMQKAFLRGATELFHYIIAEYDDDKIREIYDQFFAKNKKQDLIWRKEYEDKARELAEEMFPDRLLDL